MIDYFRNSPYPSARKFMKFYAKKLKVAFLLINLNPDFAIENEISRSIYGQTNLRLQSKQSTSGGGSFNLVTETGFRFSFHLSDSNLVRISSAIFV